MECRRCQSGYRVNPNKGEKFCGFCGTPLKSFHPEIHLNGPFYVDDPGPIKAEIRLKNVGVVDIKIDSIDFS